MIIKQSGQETSSSNILENTTQRHGEQLLTFLNDEGKRKKRTVTPDFCFYINSGYYVVTGIDFQASITAEGDLGGEDGLFGWLGNMRSNSSQMCSMEFRSRFLEGQLNTHLVKPWLCVTMWECSSYPAEKEMSFPRNISKNWESSIVHNLVPYKAVLNRNTFTPSQLDTLKKPIEQFFRCNIISSTGKRNCIIDDAVVGSYYSDTDFIGICYTINSKWTQPNRTIEKIKRSDNSRLNNAFRFVEWAQNEIAVVSDFHKRILFSDEVHFWLNGYVNKQNCRIWSEANPQVYVETPLYPEKLTVWCALWAGGIIGPYFFKNDEGHNVTVNGDRYRAIITNFFIPELNNHDV
ncbi:uncharacterized protein TNCV_2844031 [Trichonephila clavipes]|nr:uncharacterized protein TNCV_2844031 [Trichonephila clavipes]